MKVTLDKSLNSISHNGETYEVKKGVVELPDDVYAELKEQLDAFAPTKKGQEAETVDGSEAE
jgi:hypothetical protein